MNHELHDLRRRNEQLAGDIDLLQIREDVMEERNHAKIEEVVGKAKIARAIWFKENTIKRHPNVVPSLEWSGTKYDDESSDSSDSESNSDGHGIVQ